MMFTIPSTWSPIAISINLFENTSIGISINLEHSEASTENGLSSDDEEEVETYFDLTDMGSPYLVAQSNR